METPTRATAAQTQEAMGPKDAISDLLTNNAAMMTPSDSEAIQIAGEKIKLPKRQSLILKFSDAPRLKRARVYAPIDIEELSKFVKQYKEMGHENAELKTTNMKLSRDMAGMRISYEATTQEQRSQNEVNRLSRVNVQLRTQK
ncbi:hypothetical protein NX059_000800 [Plenodomus lindquistii]|nr:hypothetical protein NX059_000800 [Plenodomus lindquistii]